MKNWTVERLNEALSQDPFHGTQVMASEDDFRTPAPSVNLIYVARDVQNVVSDVAWEAYTGWFPKETETFKDAPGKHIAVWTFWGIVGIMLARTFPIAYCSWPLAILILSIYLPNAIRVMKSDMSSIRKGMLLYCSIGYLLETILYLFPFIGSGLGFDYEKDFKLGLYE